MTPKPTKLQLDYYKEGLACFMHFGMNTFTDVEWGDGKASLDSFQLVDFDYDDYVKTIKELGFKRLIVTAKHHDGFCLWHSKQTNYHIGNTSYQKDFLKELSKACSQYNMNMGIYLSPWDAHEPSYGSGQAYNEFYLNQIEEICQNPDYGNQGKFIEWWFDGAKDPNFVDQDYDFDAWMAMVRKYNPDILMFGVGSYGGIHWSGNEEGEVLDPNLNRLPKHILEIDYDKMKDPLQGHHSGYVWSVPEADTPTTSGWFWHSDESIKSKEKLIDIYFKSIGRGGVLLLNIAPNTDGNIPSELKRRLFEVKNELSQLFATNLLEGMEATVSLDNKTTSYSINLADPVEAQVLSLHEEIEKGQKIIDCQVYFDDQLMTEFKSIGYKRLYRFEKRPIKDINIICESIDQVALKDIKLY